MVNPILVSLMSGLAGAGLTALLLKDEPDGSVSITSGGQPIVNIPSNLLQASIEIPVQDISVTLKRITAPATKGDPQLTITNQINGNKLQHLSFIPDATFKSTGQLEIDINGSTVLNTDVADLTDVDALTIPIPNEGIELDQGQGIKFNAWDSATGSVTVLILTGVK
jgi:hypothetical protein